MKNKKTFAAAAILLVLVIGVFLAWSFFRPSAVTGDKTVTVTVVHSDLLEKVFEIRTDSTNLRGALDKESIVSGEDGPYGLYILTADNETADESLQQWWCVTKDGAEVMTGVDGIMIADGDRYEITLKTGW